MGKQDYNGKRDEKEEKELNKQEEKSAEEKWRRDPLGAIVWASILIWAGVVMLLANLGVFDLLTDFFDGLPLGLGDSPFQIAFIPLEGWAVFWVGAAAILFIEVVVRLLMPEYRRPVMGTLVLAIVFLGIGSGLWQCVLPLMLIGFGLSLLLRNIGRNE